jgi:hypothetical protein
LNADVTTGSVDAVGVNGTFVDECEAFIGVFAALHIID